MDLNSFLEELSEEQLSSLYESYWTCQAVLRSLPPLAQQYVLRLLFVEKPIEKKFFDCWVEPSFTGKHIAAVTKLQRLKILRVVRPSQGGGEFVQLQSSFRKRVQDSVTGRGSYIESVPFEAEGSCPSVEQLTVYARDKWEALLLYLVGQNKQPPTLPQSIDVKPVDVENLLRSAGLIQAGGRGSGADGRITQQGFHFLLMDSHQQLWRVLKQYIKQAASAEGRQLSWVISFLLQLGWRQVGRPYSFNVLAPDEQMIAGHMMQLGLLRGWKIKNKIYYAPTTLATSLCGGGLGGGSTSESLAGHIMVETNYRVYAHTSSQIQISILQLFCRTECILPNLYVGTLSRDSINEALRCGISAEQIVGYLQKHAHPHVAKRVPIVPEVVADQIRLWEADSKRVRSYPACLYMEFGNKELFRQAVEHAKSAGVYIWHNEAQEQLACAADGHEGMKQHIQRVRERLNSSMMSKQNGSTY